MLKGKKIAALTVSVMLFAAALPSVRAEGPTDAHMRSIPYAALSISDGAESITESPEIPDRIIEIHKTEGEKIPLPGIIFKIYRVAALDQPEAEDILLTQKPTREDIRRYRVPEGLVATLTTDPDGFASFNFTENGCPDGIYMVVELPDISGEVTDPFFLRIPGIPEDGTQMQCTVTIRSKRAVDSVPDIAVDILEPDKREASFDVFRPHLRILRVSIPMGLDRARKFTVSDTLPPQLAYVWGSPIVKLFTGNGEERQLQWNTHYYLSEGTLSGDAGPEDHFVIALTQQGMSFIMGSLVEGTASPELRVYYEACIDESAVPGTYIHSRAQVDHVDRYGRGFYAEAQSAGVCTGGIKLHRADMDGLPLAGTRFRIAREAEEAGPADPGVEVEKLTVDGKLLDVVFVSFVPGMDLSLPRVDTVATDENGDVSFCGLAHGTYYIVETGGPAEPIEVRIDDMSHRTDDDRDHTVLVMDPKVAFPQTEGKGTMPITAAGLGIVFTASLMLLVNYRRGRL